MATKQGALPAGVALMQQQIEITSLQDLKHFIDKEFKEIKEEFKELKEMVQDNRDKYEQLDKNLQILAMGMSDIILKIDNKVEELALNQEIKMKEFDLKLVNVAGEIHRLDNEIVMLQFRSMGTAIRLRGIRENPKEDIKRICADALSILLKLDSDQKFFNIDKIYRVNSQAALQRQLPRDVVVYFIDRDLRNDILQKSFHSALQIDGNQIGVFKELPPAMLKSRRDFGFLVAELKKRKIQYRWDVPMGIIPRYEGVSYRLNTLEKAEGFYYTVLKAGVTPSRTLTPSDIEMEQKQFGKEMEEHIQLDSPGPFLSSTLEELSKTAIGGSVGIPMFKLDEQCEARPSTRQIQKPQKQRRSQSQRVKKDKRIKGRSN